MIDLSGFTGTEKYYRVGNQALLTDGTKYLADEAQCYWLFEDTALYLYGYQKQDGFAVIRLERDGQGFRVQRGDGNGKWDTLFKGEFTTFPEDMMPFEFYAIWEYEARCWVLLLTSEY